MITIDCKNKVAKEINHELRTHIANGETTFTLTHPEGAHNLAVGFVQPIKIYIKGTVGYYCGGMIDQAHIVIDGSTGWAAAESMMSGTVEIKGNGGNSTAATIRGGTVVVHGDSGARSGIAMKGGTLVIGGSCGYMTGFMMQKGRIIVCGDAGEGVADSMYAGTMFVAGSTKSLGTDAVIEEPSIEDLESITSILNEYRIPVPTTFKKIVAGQKLWHFNKKERSLWKEVL